MLLGKMAEFVIEKVSKDGGRLAHLTLQTVAESGSSSATVYSTPAFFIHTLSGSVPHISAEVLEYIYPSIPSGDEQPRPPLQVSVDSTLAASEAIGNFGKGIAKFVGLPDSPVFLTVNNPLNPLKTGCNDKAGIAVWSRHGKQTISPKNFDKIVTDYKPSLFQCLSDYDVSSESSLKRVKKSTARNIEYFEDINKSGKHRGTFVTIESAWFAVDETEASKALTTILEKLDQIDGFVISGLSGSPKKIVKYNEKPEPVDVKDVDYSLLEIILSKLPQDKPRFVPGPFSPEQIVELIVRGVDLFDSSFVTKMADSGDVLVLDRLLEDFLPFKEMCVNEELPVRNDDKEKTDIEATSSRSLLSLKEKRFFDDFTPISKKCCCYTCRKHTRAYINHLYTTDELLGPVLVMIHNLTSFSQLFEVIRCELKKEDTGDIVNQFKLSKIKTCI